MLFLQRSRMMRYSYLVLPTDQRGHTFHPPRVGRNRVQAADCSLRQWGTGRKTATTLFLAMPAQPSSLDTFPALTSSPWCS